jgi:hypothetical protein
MVCDQLLGAVGAKDDLCARHGKCLAAAEVTRPLSLRPLLLHGISCGHVLCIVLRLCWRWRSANPKLSLLKSNRHHLSLLSAQLFVWPNRIRRAVLCAVLRCALI